MMMTNETGRDRAPPAPIPNTTTTNNSNNTSIWNAGYKAIGKRIEHTSTVLDEVARLISERSELERKYAQSLLKFSKRWQERLPLLPIAPDSALGVAFHAVCDESAAVSACHSDIETRLTNDLLAKATKYKKVHLTKNLFGTIVCAKVEMQGLEDAKKPWNKALQEIEKQKQKYKQKWCQVDRLCATLLQAELIETETTDQECEKLQKKIVEATEEARAAQEKYELRLQELEKKKPSYELDIRRKFEECQEEQRSRIEFVKGCLFSYNAIVCLTENRQYNEAYQSITTRLCDANPDQDLERFSAEVGASSEVPMPPFEPWVPAEHPVDKHLPQTRAPGAFFVKSSSAGGMSHKRFFVMCDKELRYFNTLEHGVPRKYCNKIDLKQVKQIYLGECGIQLASDSKVWCLNSPKKQLLSDWAAMLCTACNLPLSTKETFSPAAQASEADVADGDDESAEVLTEDAAAVIIQKNFRCYRLRRDYKIFKSAAIYIQRWWRTVRLARALQRAMQSAAAPRSARESSASTTFAAASSATSSATIAPTTTTAAPVAATLRKSGDATTIATALPGPSGLPAGMNKLNASGVVSSKAAAGHQRQQQKQRQKSNA